MLPDPLHPAVVHLPLALAMLLPLGALAAALAIARGAVGPRFWAVLVALQLLLAGSAFLAVETGEDQEERVEEVVGEAPLESHEEAAERLLWVAAAAAAVADAGLLPGAAGRAGRAATVATGALALAAALQVGHSGGALVYQHGAAQAYGIRGDAPASLPDAGLRDDD